MKQPLAYIHPDAKIANTVVIEPFVTIDKNVVIGEGTRIGRNGWDGANGQLNGWVDEVRMVAGYARTSNYSPATSEFPNS